jgi:threonine/homoserine/homoserine lactone efflux protein
VAADSPHKAAAFVLLGLIFVFNGTLWCLGVAGFAASAAGRIRQSGQALRWINRALGGLFVYLGVRVAMLQAR